MSTPLRTFILAAFLPVTALAGDISNSVDPNTLRAEKITPQMQYLTSEDAFNLLIVSPEILFIDVRDPVEILLGGHPELIDAVVPVRLQSNVFNEDLLEWELKDNPDFLKYMDAALTEFGKTKGDMIVLTCGSGWRSAFAAGKLYDAGYTDVWHITDGYDGEEKPGLNSANAWHLQGFPWSYDAVLGSDNLQIAQ